MAARLLFFLCFLSCFPVHAQPEPSAHARRLFTKSLKYRVKNNPEKAFDIMQRAIRASPDFEDAYGILGEWYLKSHRYSEAVELYKQASANCPGGHRNYARLLATSLLYGGNLAEAISVSRRYGNNTEEWQRLNRQMAFVSGALAKPWSQPVTNMGIRVNTPRAEMFPHISADGNSLFYTRRVSGVDEDLYCSQRDSCGGWFSGEALEYPVNTLSQEAAQTISADRHYMFFMRCDNRSPNGWSNGGCDLFMAYTPDSSWSVPQSFGATINTPGYEGMPCLSPDNRELFFVSDRPGGYGGLDIWVSRFESGLWQQPRNLGPEVNTPGNETTPFLYADNVTLLFSSDGHPGMGGADLFMSRRVSDTTWTAAQNLGYPINTTYDEAGICLSADGKKAFLSSNRDKLEGDYDLYEMEWPAALQPEPVTFVAGRVYDSLSGRALNYASIFIHDLQGNELAHYTSNRGDGSFMVVMPVGVTYLLSVYRVGYQSLFDTLHYAEQHLAPPAGRHIALLPSDYQRPTTDTQALSVYFRMNSLTLNDSTRARIQEIVSYWKDQPQVQVIINGYTDNIGTPMINEQLSYQRAGLVASEVIRAGFAPEDVYAQGWGEANPVADNDTEEHRDMNRRVEIIIRK